MNFLKIYLFREKGVTEGHAYRHTHIHTEKRESGKREKRQMEWEREMDRETFHPLVYPPVVATPLAEAESRSQELHLRRLWVCRHSHA